MALPISRRSWTGTPDPASGHTKSFWLTAEAAALIDQLRLREGRLPELPRWHGTVPRWGVLVIPIDPPAGIVDAARFSLHYERRTGAYWLKQRGGVLGGPIVFGPGPVKLGEGNQ